MENKNYYDILGVNYNATPEEIAAAKNKLAKKLHPDVNLRKGIDTTAQMQEVLEAYATLSDTSKRAEYDREIRGTTSIMQTFDLSRAADDTADISDSGFVLYWKTSNQLFDILSESATLSRKNINEKEHSRLIKRALKYIFILKAANIPEKYWHPDIMNWLLLQSYKNRNCTTEYLISLYEQHIKNDLSFKDKLKMQKLSSKYLHSLKKLIKK